MHDSLNKVDWAKYSKSIDIAQLIRNLASTKEEIVLQARKEIDNILLYRSWLAVQGHPPLYWVFETDVVHQICPFIIEILANDDLPHKKDIIYLLDAIISLTDTGNLKNLKKQMWNSRQKLYVTGLMSINLSLAKS